jgi:hypothetical protein
MLTVLWDLFLIFVGFVLGLLVINPFVNWDDMNNP